MLFAAPEILYALIQSDYETRWKDLSPPTYEECVKFCDVAECYVDDLQQLEIKERECVLP